MSQRHPDRRREAADIGHSGELRFTIAVSVSIFLGQKREVFTVLINSASSEKIELEMTSDKEFIDHANAAASAEHVC